MDWNRLGRIAQTPREIIPELERLAPREHPAYSAGCFMVLGALAAALIAGGLAAFGVISWPWVAACALPLAVGIVVRQVFKKVALERGREKLRLAPLALASVVQANRALYAPIDDGGAPAVLVYAKHPARALDATWIAGLGAFLRSLRDHGTADPALLPLVARLTDERGWFDEELPLYVTNGVPARWRVHFLSRQQLPGWCLPPDGVLPILDLGTTVEVVPLALWA